MNRLPLFALLALALFPSLSPAVDIKNIRACYGPLGATRDDKTCLPGDVFFMSYDVENLTLDKTGKASYSTKFEFIDNSNKKVLFEKDSPIDIVPQLGGARVPADVHIIIPPKQAAGKYTMKVTIVDKLGKDAKAFSYALKVTDPTFGFVGVMSPRAGWVGQPYPYLLELGLVNMTLDAKKKPDAKVTIRVLDDKGKQVRPTTELSMPRDMPDDTDLEKANFVPIRFPIALNRPGRFRIEVQGTDKTGKKSASLSVPLTVIDVGTITGN